MSARADAPEPTIVRGVSVVVGADGTAHRVERPAVALCACALSRLAPWCDGTHKALRNERPDTVTDRRRPDAGAPPAPW
ncbi:CDGSH iron-sulfur domain-containing protein [Nocardioides daejeonensis]|uniref:CDGSH iron-sulfur domain-containing protein n=1 Tax=Nocardioides daejeonensis TaxID=1046556 RepID=UPI000D74F792|nr:CDGSH iron-sulfur domain-containing protein [Nocardioides daejeonensis]